MKQIKKLVNEVLTKGTIMSLGTVDSSGPWVADLLYVHDTALNLYWISRKQRRHSKALRTNPMVAATITILNSPDQKDLGVQLEGRAEELSEIPTIVDKYWKKRGAAPKQPITEEHTWYVLRPTKIEIICETLYGHEKKILTLPQ